MLTRLSQFFSILATNKHGFSAKSPGYRKGTIRRSGMTPAEVVYEALTGYKAGSDWTALVKLFSSEKRRFLIGAAADAPHLLHFYQRLYFKVRKASGQQAALRVEREWQTVLSVRGQMFKALGMNDTLRDDDRLSGIFQDTREDKGVT